MTRYISPFVLLAAVSLSPDLSAQSNFSSPNAPEVCASCEHECEQNNRFASKQERLRIAAETRMLENRARRDRAAARLLQSQRAVAQEEKRRIQADRRAILSEAKQREWAHRSANVTLNNLTGNLHRHHTLVLQNVTGIDPKHTVAQVHQILANGQGLDFVNPLKIKRKYRTHKNLDPSFIRTRGVLHASIHRETLNEYGRFVRLVVKDHTGSIVYDARYENMHFGEMLAPLEGMPSL